MSSSSVPGSLGRNDPCHCGSGKKYKPCHLAAGRGRAARRAREGGRRGAGARGGGVLRGKAAPSAAPRGKTHQPWKRRPTQNTRGFQKVAGTRKVGGG